MYFLITAHDGTDADALARRMSVRPQHFESIQRVKETGSVVCAGGITAEDGHLVGSFLVLDFETRELLDAYLAQEPYVLANVWQDIRVETCNVAVMNDEIIGK